MASHVVAARCPQPPATIGWPGERLTFIVTEDSVVGASQLEDVGKARVAWTALPVRAASQATAACASPSAAQAETWEPLVGRLSAFAVSEHRLRRGQVAATTIERAGAAGASPSTLLPSAI